MTKPKKTKHQGIYRLEDRRWKIKVTMTEPITGKRVARQRVIEAATAAEAVVAKERLREELLAEMTGQQPHSRRSTTLSDFAERWIEGKARRVRPGVADLYIDIVGKRVLPVLGHLPAAEITRSHVDRWVAWAESQQSTRGQAYARDSLRQWWRIMRNLLRDLAAEFGVPDPTLRVRPPDSEVRNVTEGRALSVEQLGLLLTSVRELFPDWYPEVHVLAYTGMRPGEIHALRWADVDAERDVIVVRRSVYKGVENPTKTGDPREAALSERMKLALEEQRRSLADEGRPTGEDDLVFPNPKGSYRSTSALASVLKLTATAAKIPIRVGPKTLRKTFISLATLSGHDRLAIRANVGHCDEEMTERYTWVDSAAKLRVVEALEARCDCASEQVRVLPDAQAKSYLAPEEAVITADSRGAGAVGAGATRPDKGDLGKTSGNTRPSEAGDRATAETRSPQQCRGLSRGAGYRVRTGDIQLGKLTLYQLS